MVKEPGNQKLKKGATSGEGKEKEKPVEEVKATGEIKIVTRVHNDVVTEVKFD